MKPADVLAIVEDRFLEIQKQLDLHLQRAAQIQAQLDHVEMMVKRVFEEGVPLRRERSSQIQH